MSISKVVQEFKWVLGGQSYYCDSLLVTRVDSMRMGYMYSKKYVYSLSNHSFFLLKDHGGYRPCEHKQFSKS